jgi:glucose-1-phosphatase
VAAVELRGHLVPVALARPRVVLMPQQGETLYDHLSHAGHRMIDRIDALLFDLGGVLVEIDFERVCARWAEAASLPVAHVKARFSHGEAYARHERGEIGIAAYCDALRHELQIELDDEQLVEGWQRVFVKEIEPTVRLLRALRGRVPMYLFSNTNPTHYAYWRERYAAALEPLERIFVSNEIGMRKPERAAFEHIAREIGVPPERILFFDDTLSNVEAARALGMPSVLVRRPEDVRLAVQPWLAVAGDRTGT